MACRSLEVAEVASKSILKRCSSAAVDLRQIDLTSLQSVVDFVQKLRMYFSIG